MEETNTMRRERFSKTIDTYISKKPEEYSVYYNIGYLSGVLTNILINYVGEAESERLLKNYFIDQKR